jgi:hypothetical protein
MRSFLQKLTHIRLIHRVHGPFTVIDRQNVLLNIQDAFKAGEYTTSVVIEDSALAGHLVGAFEALWDAAPAKQAALISAWEASRS